MWFPKSQEGLTEQRERDRGTERHGAGVRERERGYGFL
jgi:hypothetical protein